MKKYLNILIFGVLVLAVVGLAVNHSRKIRGLVTAMTSRTPGERAAAALELIKAEQFLDSVSGEPVDVRVKSVEALEILASPEAVKQLLPMLKDQDKLVRDRAVVALQAIAGKSQSTLDQLMPGLKEGDANIRKGTIAVLTAEKGGIGPRPGVVTTIVGYMKKEGGARGPGGDVLSSSLFIKNGANAESLPALMALLDDKDEGVRGGAGEALGKIGDKAAVPRLIQATKQDTAQIRRIAIGSIALIADPSGEAVLVEAINNPDDDNEARAQAAAGLGKLASPTAIATLVKALSDDDLKLRSAAVAAMARAARPTADAPTNPQIIAALNEALRGQNAAARLSAAQALQTVAATELNPTLIAIVNNEKDESALRAAAVLALGFKNNTPAVAPLIRHLNDPVSEEVSTATKVALAAIGSEAIAPLIAAMQQDEVVAFQAAQALAKQGTEVLPALTKAAQEGNATTHRWVAVALGELGIAEARPILEQLGQSTDASVAYVAKEQLNRLGR